VIRIDPLIVSLTQRLTLEATGSRLQLESRIVSLGYSKGSYPVSRIMGIDDSAQRAR
jgi:hypothetical protein